MPVKIELFFDYVCPFCYLAEKPFEEAIAGRDVEVAYYPFELRRPPEPPADPMHDEKRLQRFHEVLKPAADALGIEMKLPFISPHPYTTLAFQGFYFAQEQGRGADYNRAVFGAFYREERDIGRREVLEGILASLGLSAEGFGRALAAGTYLPRLDASKAYAREVGIKAIPTMIIGGARIVGGHDRAEFERAIEAARRQG